MLKDIIGKNQNKIKTSLYVAVKVDKNTEELLNQKLEKLGIAKDFDDEFHCTLIYSRKEVLIDKDILNERPFDLFSAKVKGYTIFESEVYGKSFVLKLDCEKCIEMHKKFMNEYDASFDYEEYIPHVTLVYNLEKTEEEYKKIFNEFKDIKISFDKIIFEPFNNEKYKNN